MPSTKGMVFKADKVPIPYLGPKRAQGIFNGCGQYGGQLRYCTGWGNRPAYPQCFVFVLENQGCKLTFAVGLAATT